MKKMYAAPLVDIEFNILCQDVICTSDATGAWKWEDDELS